MHDLEFKGKDDIEEVCTRGGRLDTCEDGEEVGAFGGCLVEEAEAGKAA